MYYLTFGRMLAEHPEGVCDKRCPGGEATPTPAVMYGPNSRKPLKQSEAQKKLDARQRQ